MPNTQSIHTFAEKYLALFSDSKIIDYDLHEPFCEEWFFIWIRDGLW